MKRVIPLLVLMLACFMPTSASLIHSDTITLAPDTIAHISFTVDYNHTLGISGQISNSAQILLFQENNYGLWLNQTGEEDILFSTTINNTASEEKAFGEEVTLAGIQNRTVIHLAFRNLGNVETSINYTVETIVNSSVSPFYIILLVVGFLGLAYWYLTRNLES